MKKLLIDMDDVICDDGFMSIVNEFLGTNYKPEDAHSYYINDLIPKEKFDDWVKYFEERNVYDYGSMKKDAREVIEKLNKVYETYIITAYVFRDKPEISGDQLRNKFNYLRKNLPFVAPSQYIFISNKALVDGDIRIDDRVSNLEGKAEMKLLINAYHNRDISDEELAKKNIKRVDNWKEIEEILL